MIENSAASTADWVSQTQGGVIYSYDVVGLLERRPQEAVATPRHSAVSALLAMTPTVDLIAQYAAATHQFFKSYNGPDEPMVFDPDDFPVR